MAGVSRQAERRAAGWAKVSLASLRWAPLPIPLSVVTAPPPGCTPPAVALLLLLLGEAVVGTVEEGSLSLLVRQAGWWYPMNIVPCVQGSWSLLPRREVPASIYSSLRDLSWCHSRRATMGWQLWGPHTYSPLLRRQSSRSSGFQS